MGLLASELQSVDDDGRESFEAVLLEGGSRRHGERGDGS